MLVVLEALVVGVLVVETMVETVFGVVGVVLLDGVPPTTNWLEEHPNQYSPVSLG